MAWAAGPCQALIQLAWAESQPLLELLGALQSRLLPLPVPGGVCVLGSPMPSLALSSEGARGSALVVALAALRAHLNSVKPMGSFEKMVGT